MADETLKEWVLPASIPFAELKRKETVDGRKKRR